MKNHLFIGLGGFGGKTLAEIRKYEYLNRHKVADNPAEAPNVDYLYVDSSRDVINDSALWRVLGENVRLDPTDLVSIRDGSIAQAINHIDDLPHIRNWVGDKESIRNYLQGQGGTDGANQRRRFGRFLFASNADEFLNKLNQKVSRLGSTQDCTFHIFATFAGGTGSGALIDAVTLIRSQFSDDRDYPIFVYGFATSRKQDYDKHNVGFFFPNQYAVMRDLNALMTGRYQPQDLAAKREAKVDSMLKYVDQVAIVTPVNRENVKFEPKEQVKAAGQWVYQRVLAEASNRIPADAVRAFSGEDVLAARPGEMDEKGVQKRSCRFASIGMKRWGIPEEEVVEAFMLDYLEQALNQMIHNRWDHENGYMTSDGDSPVSSRELLDVMGLGSHSNWILSADSNFRTYDVEWERAAGKVPYTGALVDSIANLGRELDDYSHREFREAGVEPYFQARLQGGVPQHVKAAIRKLASWLNDSWKEGKVGTRQLEAALEGLEAELGASSQQFQKESSEESDSPKEVMTRWRSHAEKVGWLSKKLGVEEKMYNRFRADMSLSYVRITSKRGSAYAAELADRLRDAVAILRGALTQTAQKLSLLREEVRKDRAPLLDRQAMDQSNDEIEFEPDAYDEIWRAMRADEPQLKTVIRTCRKIVQEDSRELTTLHAMNQELLRTELEGGVEELVRLGHDKVCDSNPQLVGKELLGQSVLGLFASKNDQELSNRVEEFVASAVTMAKRKSAEPKPRDLDPNFEAKMPKECILLFTPQTQSHQAAGQNLRSLFEAKLGQGEFEFVNHGDQAELLCFSIDAAMPARMLGVVHELRDYYLEKVSGEEGRYFCHLDPESEGGDTHPDLLAPVQGARG